MFAFMRTFLEKMIMHHEIGPISCSAGDIILISHNYKCCLGHITFVAGRVGRPELKSVS